MARGFNSEELLMGLKVMEVEVEGEVLPLKSCRWLWAELMGLRWSRRLWDDDGERTLSSTMEAVRRNEDGEGCGTAKWKMGAEEDTDSLLWVRSSLGSRPTWKIGKH